jgi:hypothetical protein
MTNPQNSPYSKARGEVQTIIAALAPHLQSMLRQEIAMVENQHRQIKGYRDLTAVEINAMNDCKLVAIEVGIMCDRVEAMENVDKRWVAIGRTQLQQGFMALIRGIAKPETF